jgi:hypothetical protein
MKNSLPVFALISALLLFLSSCTTQKSPAYAYSWSPSESDDNLSLGFDSNLKAEEMSVNFRGSRNVYAADQVRLEAREGKPAIENRLITYNGRMDLTVKEPDSVALRIKALALQYHGFATDLSSNSITIKVNAKELNNAMEAVSKMGYVTYKRINGSDITDTYYNTQIRLDNALKARERYLELLAKAENVSAALLVEKELERLNGVIDEYQGQMKRMQESVQYSTLTVYLKQKPKLGILGYVGVGLYKGVKWFFVRG